MLLGVCSGNTFLDGTESKNSVTTVSPDTIGFAKQAFYDFGERPIWAERAMYGTGVHSFVNSMFNTQRERLGEGKGTMTYSGRRDGLALYIGRLVRPIWRSKLTKLRYAVLSLLQVAQLSNVAQPHEDLRTLRSRKGSPAAPKESVCTQRFPGEESSSLPFIADRTCRKS
jgi:hypothetical protein